MKSVGRGTRVEYELFELNADDGLSCPKRGVPRSPQASQESALVFSWCPSHSVRGGQTPDGYFTSEELR